MATEKHWFWRGVQSAIFYYVSCAPWLDYRYKRKRRNEAKEAAAIALQPAPQQSGEIRQARAFETNENWAEELMIGPGPPKGWKEDQVLRKYSKRAISKMISTKSLLPSNLTTTQQAPKILVEDVPRQAKVEITTAPPTVDQPQPTATPIAKDYADTPVEENSQLPEKVTLANPLHRMSMERKLSSAIVNIKESVKATLHPDKWNWTRYDREDEVLGGYGEKMQRMWNRATTSPEEVAEVEVKEGPKGRRRAATNDTDRYDYYSAKNPAVNDLHPPVVSSLPRTVDDAAWMLLPPPSAAIMAGKVRPAAEAQQRWPLAVCGTTTHTSAAPAAEKHKKSPDMQKRQHFEDNTVQSGGSEYTNSDFEYGSDDEKLDEGTAGHVRHQSEPSGRQNPTRIPLPPDTHASKRRSEPWKLEYLI